MGVQDLSPRQREILMCLGHGWSDSYIAAVLRISPGTVRNHVQTILHRTGAKNRTELALLAHGITPEQEEAHGGN